MWKNKDAVIFDLDGTLVDSMWMWRQIDIEFLGERGIALPEDLQQKIEGMSFRETAVYMQERFQLKETVEELMDIWNKMAFEKYKNEVPLKRGIQKFLEHLKACQIKMGIATSNSPLLVETVLKAQGIFEYFDSIHTANEVEKGKPAPDVYLLAAQDFQIDPKHCLVFEDVPMGILAGKNAGMKVCAVYDVDSAHQEEKKRALADYYIQDFEDIKNNTYEVL